MALGHNVGLTVHGGHMIRYEYGCQRKLYVGRRFCKLGQSPCSFLHHYLDMESLFTRIELHWEVMRIGSLPIFNIHPLCGVPTFRANEAASTCMYQGTSLLPIHGVHSKEICKTSKIYHMSSKFSPNSDALVLQSCLRGLPSHSPQPWSEQA